MTCVTCEVTIAPMIKSFKHKGIEGFFYTGNKKGQYAVKVSGNWRIFFKFIAGDAYIVDYDDYH